MLGLDVVRRGLVASLPDAQGICWVGQPSEAAMADFFFKEQSCSMLMGTQGWGLHWTIRISCHWGHEVSGHDRSELALEQTLHCRGMTRAFGSFGLHASSACMPMGQGIYLAD